jgi:hypothetical protein
MAFVLAWAIGDCIVVLSCESVYQVHFVWSMSSGIVTQSKSMSSIYRASWSFSLRTWPFVALRSAVMGLLSYL